MVNNMEIKMMLVSAEKYKIKCPYIITPKYIVVHNTANDASASNEVSYMINNKNEVSFHFAVDDKEVVEGIALNRNAWHAGDGTYKNSGNMNGIAVEICYSKSGGERFIEAEKKAAKFIAQLLKENGWGIDKVKKHQDFNGKYCPHRTMDLGWGRFLNMISIELNSGEVQVQKPQSIIKSDIEKEAERYGLRVATALPKGSEFYISEYASIYGGASYGVAIPDKIKKAPSIYTSGGEINQHDNNWVLATQINSFVLVNECLIK